jgi:hypothetical protein
VLYVEGQGALYVEEVGVLYVEVLGALYVEGLGTLYVEEVGALYVEELRSIGQPRRGAPLFCCPCSPPKVGRVNRPSKGDSVGLVGVFSESTKVCCTWRR